MRGGPGETAASVLTALARRDAADPWVRLAVLCSVGDRGGAVYSRLLRDPDARGAGTTELLLALAAQTAAANRPDEVAEVVKGIDALPDAERPLARQLVQAFASKLPPAARPRFAGFAAGKTGAILKDLLADAARTAADETVTPAARAAAIRTLGLGSFADARARLVSALAVRQPPAVQLAALEVLGRFDSPEVPGVVLAAWPGMSPPTRASAAETLLARAAWVTAFLDAVEKGTVRPTDLEPARVQLLQQSADGPTRTRAARVFTGAGPARRADVVAKYQRALDLPGDAVKGKAAFKEHCAACHKLEGVGEAVGPDLSSIKNRGAEAVLTNILDPNREVLPQYYSYLLVTDADVILTGMIAAETANTVTIRKADGTTETVQRVNIASLRSTGLSAMPEGLEDKLGLQAAADLLAYLRSIR